MLLQKTSKTSISPQKTYTSYIFPRGSLKTHHQFLTRTHTETATNNLNFSMLNHTQTSISQQHSYKSINFHHQSYNKHQLLIRQHAKHITFSIEITQQPQFSTEITQTYEFLNRKHTKSISSTNHTTKLITQIIRKQISPQKIIQLNQFPIRNHTTTSISQQKTYENIFLRWSHTESSIYHQKSHKNIKLSTEITKTSFSSENHTKNKLTESIQLKNLIRNHIKHSLTRVAHTKTSTSHQTAYKNINFIDFSLEIIHKSIYQ